MSESKEGIPFCAPANKTSMSGQPERNPRNEEEEEEDDPPSPPRPEPAPAPPNNIGRNRQAPEEEAPIIPIFPNEISRHIISFFAVQTIMNKQSVSKTFRKALLRALKEKKKPNAGKFKTKQQLKVATNKLIKCKYIKFDPDLAEEIAQEYGWIMNLWDVSEIEDFSYLFAFKEKFNEDISMWNVSSGRDFSSMFLNAKAFKGDLSEWNLENATTLNEMFARASSFCSDLSQWNVASVESMSGMFARVSSFTSDLSKWETGNVTNMSEMFLGASSFQSDLSGWETGNVAIAAGMFREASTFQSDLSGWNTASIIDMRCMFCNATLFKADLSRWNVDRALQDDSNSTYGMFFNCSIKPKDVKEWTGWNFTLANNFRNVFQMYRESSNGWERFKRQLEEEAASKNQDSKGKK